MKKDGIRESYPGWSDLLALLGVFVAITVLCGIVFEFLVRAGSVSQGFGNFLAYTIQFSVTILYALFIKRMRTGGKGALLRFGFKKVNPAIVLWGLIMTVATSLVIEPLINTLPSETLELLNKQMGQGGWMMLTAIVMAPVCEEILFRGILQDSLTRKYGALRGILIAAAVFGVIHIIPQQVVNAFFVGIVLGYIYYKTQSLVPVILIHAINNAISYFSWMLGGEKIVSTREMISNDTLYYIVYGIAWLIFIVAFVIIGRTIARDRKRSQPAVAGAELEAPGRPDESAGTDKVSDGNNNINRD